MRGLPGRGEAVGLRGERSFSSLGPCRVEGGREASS